MMVQDKLVNPCQAIQVELAHLLRSPVGERKKWSAGGETAGTESEATAHAVNKAAHDERARTKEHGQTERALVGADTTSVFSNY
jgi:hypothetical protein